MGFRYFTFLVALVDINALSFPSGINIDLGPQQTLNTSNRD